MLILEPIQCDDCGACLDKSQLVEHYKERHVEIRHFWSSIRYD